MNLTKCNVTIMGVLGLATFLFYYILAGALPITDPVESNYVLTAKEMLLRNDYMTPYIYGKPWFDKPIWTYWMLILSFKLFGINDWAARLPAIATAGLNVSFLYYTALRLFKDSKIALWSGLILATTLEFWYISHAIITDGYLFFGTIGIFLFAYLGLTERKKRYLMYAYAFSGFTVLVKGPVGLVLPGLILLSFIILNHRWQDLKLLFYPPAILIFLLVALPWYSYMYTLHGLTFIEDFLGLHNYLRATISEHPRFNVWYYYIVLWLIGFLPWTGAALYALKNSSKGVLKNYLLCWGIGIILFYSCMATKYLTYTFIALIPFVLLTAQGLVHLEERRPGRLLATLYLYIPLCLLLVVLVVGKLFFGSDLPSYVLYAAIITMICLALAIKRHKPYYRSRSIVVSMLCVYLAILCSLPPIMRPTSTRDLVEHLPYQMGSRVYFYHEYATSFNYYTPYAAYLLTTTDSASTEVWDEGRRVMPWETPSQVLKYLQENPSTPIIVCVRKKSLTDFQQLPLAKKLQVYKVIDNMIIYVSPS